MEIKFLFTLNTLSTFDEWKGEREKWESRTDVINWKAGTYQQLKCHRTQYRVNEVVGFWYQLLYGVKHLCQKGK